MQEPGAPVAPIRNGMRLVAIVVSLKLLLLGLAAGGWWYLQTRPATPLPGNLTIAQREEVFLAFWSMANEQYPYFEAKGIDWEQVRQEYSRAIRKAPDDAAFNRLMLAAVAELKDSHSALVVPGYQPTVPPLSLTMDGERVVIMEVFDGSQAKAAGMKPGMEIIKIDGRPAVEVWQEQQQLLSHSTTYATRWWNARGLLLGQFGTTVNVVAQSPDGRQIEATLRRQPISRPATESVEFRQLEGGIAYLRIRNFTHGTVPIKVISSMQATVAANAPGLIIDVRGNTGGAITDPVNVLDFLLPGGTPWGYEWGKSSGFGSPLTTQKRDVTYSGPVLLLTDPGCVSACDILASALQEAGRAKVVGEPPAGATAIAADRRLPHGFVLHLSAGSDLRRLDKGLIEGNPARPDYPVVPTAADWAAGRDPVLEKALQLLKP